jgi:hypothetical protein
MKTLNKTLKISLILVSLVLILGSFYYCQAEEKTYYYDSIKVEIQINRDSTFDVTEEQTHNLTGSFGYFYRDIELKKLDHISDIEVFDGEGRKLDKGEYEISNKGNQKHIQWDFPRRDFYNELKSWTVKYKVHGGLGFYKEWDELYWNAIFSDREVEVREAQIMVHLPQEIAREHIGMRMFIGTAGSKAESSNYQIIDGKTVKFWGNNIRPGEFLTVVVTWPKGLVTKPLFYQSQIIDLLVLLIALAIPIFVFFKSYKIWQEKGKDPRIKKTIIAEYEPPGGLSPALVGVLMKQKVDIKDITATVVDLAVRGYLRIREEERKVLFLKGKEYIFEKLKDESDLKPFEQEIIRGIFEGRDLVSSEDLKNKLYKKLPEIKKAIHSEVGKTDLFTGNIQEMRKKHGKTYGIILVLLIIGIIGSVIINGFLGKYIPGRFIVYVIILGVGLGISAIIGLIFANFMPALTPGGLEAKWKSLGFKEYLHTAERFRIGAETLETFSKFLPYAMVFGVEKKWAERFSDFKYQKQNWYVPAAYAHAGRAGPAGQPPSFSGFVSSFSSFTSSISRTFGSSPGGGSGMGGAGGAGGGGGGGGGGAG